MPFKQACSAKGMDHRFLIIQQAYIAVLCSNTCCSPGNDRFHQLRQISFHNQVRRQFTQRLQDRISAQQFTVCLIDLAVLHPQFFFSCQ